MTRNLKAFVLGALVFLALVHPASSISIDLSPTSVSPTVGGTFSVNVVVLGLVPQGSPRSEVGAFDLDLTFNSGAISLASVAFGVLLGNPTSGEALTDVVPGSGIVNFAEVSLLPSATLDALQPDTFTLATLSFRATTPATSILSLSRAVVGDGSGLALSVGSLGATNVTASAPAIPEPTGFLLFAIGFATVAAFGARRAGVSSRVPPGVSQQS